MISRNEIKFKKAHGENNTADAVSAELLNLLQNFVKMTYTGLFYHAMPDSTLSYKYTRLYGSKKAMAHITMLCF
jgi:hypothetical protein